MMREPGNMAGNTYGPMMIRPWTRWQNWANVVLGVILFIAPWVTGTANNLGLTADAHAAWNNWIMGIAIALIALWSLDAPRSYIPESINVLLGIWLVVAPWILVYAGLTGPAWTDWIIGILVIVFAGWAILAVSRLHSAPTA